MWVLCTWMTYSIILDLSRTIRMWIFSFANEMTAVITPPPSLSFQVTFHSLGYVRGWSCCHTVSSMLTTQYNNRLRRNMMVPFYQAIWCLFRRWNVTQPVRMGNSQAGLLHIIHAQSIHRLSSSDIPIYACGWERGRCMPHPAVSVSANRRIHHLHSMRTAASGRGNIPRFYCHISTHYIVHCVGDVIMPAWYE
jgi:hypothetical protein